MTRKHWTACVLLILALLSAVLLVRAGETVEQGEAPSGSETRAVDENTEWGPEQRQILDEPSQAIARAPESVEHAGDSAPFRIVGTVVDFGGQPVEGASLAVNASRRYGLGAPRPDPSGRFDSSAVLGAGRSGEGGAFSIGLDAPGSFTLRVQAAGLATKHVEYVVVGPEAVRHLAPIRLRIGHSVSGVIVGPSGDAVPGATLSIAPPGAIPDVAFSSVPGPRWRSLAEEVGRSDEAGRFLLSNLGPGQLRLLVEAPRFASKIFEMDEIQWMSRRDLRLKIAPGLAIAGAVELNPAFEADSLEVRLTAKGASGRRALGVPVEGDGSFSFEQFALEDQSGPFEVRAVDQRITLRTASRVHAVVPGDLNVQLPLFSALAVEFEAVDGLTGGAIRPASVHALHTSQRRPTAVFPIEEVSFDGELTRILVPRPPDGRRLGLSILADGYEGIHLLDVEVEGRFDLKLGRIEMTPIPRLSVKVVDAGSGQPIKGATVRYLLDTRFLSERSLGLADALAQGEVGTIVSAPKPWGDCVTGDAGDVSVPWPTDRGGWLFAVADDHAPGEPARVEPGVAPGQAFRFELGHGAMLTASVRNSTGRPVAGLDVRLRRSADEPLGRAGFARPRLGLGDGVRRTGLDGIAQWSRLGAGTAFVTLTDDRGTSPRTYQREVELAKDASRHVEFVIDNGLTVTGTVTIDDRPAGGVTVLLTRDGEPSTPVLGDSTASFSELGSNDRTDASGAFEIRSVLAANYVLSIHGADLDSIPERMVTVREGMAPLNVEVPVRRVTGAVRTNGNDIPRGVTVELGSRESLDLLVAQRRTAVLGHLTVPGSLGNGDLDDSGRFELVFEAEMSRPWIVVFAPGYAPSVIPVSEPGRAGGSTDLGVVEVVEGGVLRVDSSALGLDFRGRITLEGPVDPNGYRPRRRAIVQGAIQAFRDLPVGRWELAIETLGGTVAELELSRLTVDVRAGETETVEIR